ncbi:MAG: DNA methyltransferase [Bacteroidota bacterium]
MTKTKQKDFGETPKTEMTPSENGSSNSTENDTLENNNGMVNEPTINESSDVLEEPPQPEVVNPSSTKDPKVLRVKITDLTTNPLKRKIYTNPLVDDLMENIIENGGVIHTPLLVTKEMVIIDGERRLECCKLLGIEKVDVVFRDINESEMDLMMVSSNLYRLKTGEEIYNEIQILQKYYGNRQGMRTDLITEVGGSDGKKEDTQTRISKTLKISKGTMTQLNDIFKHNPEYLKEIDNVNVRTNTVHSKVVKEQNERIEKERMEKLKDKEYEVKPNVYCSSPKEIMKFVQKDSIDGIISSIPIYKGKDYGNDTLTEIGTEDTVEEYIEGLLPIFENCHKVLKNTGSFFLNVCDGRDENGCELNIPHRILDSLKKLGFLCVETLIWEKTNPTSIGNNDIYRPSFEYIFHLTKSVNFKTKGFMKSMSRNVIDEQKTKFDESFLIYNGKRWDENWITNDLVRTSINQPKFEGDELSCVIHSHPLIEVVPVPMILDFTDEGDTVLDPFCGIGTVGLVSLTYLRNFIGFEENKNLHKISLERLHRKIKEMNSHKGK